MQVTVLHCFCSAAQEKVEQTNRALLVEVRVSSVLASK